MEAKIFSGFLFLILTAAQPGVSSVAPNPIPWEGIYYFNLKQSSNQCKHYISCPPDQTPFKMIREGASYKLECPLFKQSLPLTIISESVATGPGYPTPRLTKGRLGIQVAPQGEISVYAFRQKDFNSYEGYWKGQYEVQSCNSAVRCCPVGVVTVTEGTSDDMSAKKKLEFNASGSDLCKDKMFKLALKASSLSSRSFFGKNAIDKSDRTTYSIGREWDGIQIEIGFFRIKMKEY
jgi:hypothetical protein